MSYTVKWIGQGGFVFTLGAKVLCVDPYLSDSVADVEGDGFHRLHPVPVKPEELRADLIVTTHNHIDHLDKETLLYTDKSKISYSGPNSCIKEFLKMGFPADILIALNRGQTIRLGDAVIRAVHAEHTADSIGIVIEYNRVSIYLVGDSLYNDKLLDVGKYKPDILICCINGKLGNMGYSDAAKLAGLLGVKIAIPCHYGMFRSNTEDPLNYMESLKKYNVGFKKLELNKSFCVVDMLTEV